MLEEEVDLQPIKGMCFISSRCGLAMCKEEQNTLGQAHNTRFGGVAVVPGCPHPNRNLKNTDFFFTQGDMNNIYTIYIMIIYTGCNRRNGPNFGRVFLMLNYTEKPQNTYVQSLTVWEIMASEV
jgi:hypothetical protein